jgi:hypothetical protein
MEPAKVPPVRKLFVRTQERLFTLFWFNRLKPLQNKT